MGHDLADLDLATEKDVVAERQMAGAEHLFVFQRNAANPRVLVATDAEFRQIVSIVIADRLQFVALRLCFRATVNPGCKAILHRDADRLCDRADSGM